MGEGVEEEAVVEMGGEVEEGGGGGRFGEDRGGGGGSGGSGGSSLMESYELLTGTGLTRSLLKRISTTPTLPTGRWTRDGWSSSGKTIFGF